MGAAGFVRLAKQGFDDRAASPKSGPASVRTGGGRGDSDRRARFFLP